MTTKWSNRHILACLITTLIVLFVFFAGVFMVYADMPLYNMAEGSILKLDMETWGQTIGHTIKTGKLVEEGDVVYWYKTYELGTAVPKHRTMPHDFSVTFLALSPNSSETGVFITLRYARDMGGGFRGTTLLYMYDTNYDMKPDKISRRSVVSKNLRIYSGSGIINDTYVFESVLPTDMPEWNKWVMWFVEQYKKENAYVKGGTV